AGALTTGSAYSGSIFMLSFGLGTLPLLITTAYFGKSLKNKFPTLYQKVLPTMTAILGVFMIIRGIIINLPLSINFLEALTNPVLCH
ncbi:MAG TPA: sulfite exporter TauE/SafE family protein, partial [Saprospiraceae bacterium]|nr:sulfite exporter TauE/SafE family protein [Saprospiraceae bacterium]